MKTNQRVMPPIGSEVRGSRVKDGKIEAIRGQYWGGGLIWKSNEQKLIAVIPQTIIYIARKEVM